MLAGVWASARNAAVIDEFRVNQLKQAKEKATGATTRPAGATPRPAEDQPKG